MRKTILILLSILMLGINHLTLNAQNEQQTTTVENVNQQLFQKGNATYYGYHYSSKRKTASGEYFDKSKFTAAHKTLPFGTKVKVTNLKNNKSVIVKINDRGPFGKGRIIDLSVIAAKQLDMIKSGVVPVTLEIIK